MQVHGKQYHIININRLAPKVMKVPLKYELQILFKKKQEQQKCFIVKQGRGRTSVYGVLWWGNNIHLYSRAVMQPNSLDPGGSYLKCTIIQPLWKRGSLIVPVVRASEQPILSHDSVLKSCCLLSFLSDKNNNMMLSSLRRNSM